MNDNNKSKNRFADLKGVHKAVPIVLGALALFTAACLLIPDMGSVGQAIRNLMVGLFSFGAYLIPIFLGIHAFFYAEDLGENKVAHRAIFSAVIVLMVSCIDYAIYYWGHEPIFAPADGFVNGNGGGFIGGLLGFLLTSLFGNLGVIIVCIAALAIYATFYYAEKAGSIGQLALKIAAALKRFIAFIKGKKNEHDEKKRIQKEEEDQLRREITSQELIDDEFFKAKGEASDVKIKKLGIDESADTHGLSPLVDPAKRIIEEDPVVAEEPERKRRRSGDRPLDLNYGIDEEPISLEEVGTDDEDKPKYDKAFFGLDDSADSVFTKDFDPFDFATSEKAAAKYASKVSTKSSAVAEELDEMTIYQMKADHEPTEREKRLMELERKKKEWMHQHNRTQSAPAAQPTAASAPVSAAPVEEVKSAFTTAPRTPVYTAATTASSTPTTEPVSEKVSTYSSYSNTKTTYSQPIKTVEFTITKEAKPAPVAPVESGSVSYTFDKAEHNEEAAEDVAILISQRIAKNNPAYARSANDLKTYTKVVPDENDELYRQLEGLAPTEKAEEPEEVIETAYTEEIEELVLTEETETVAEEEALPQAVEFSIGEKNDEAAEPSAQATYQRAAGFASAMVSGNGPVEFRPYTPPVIPSAPAAEPAEATLQVERNILPPTPAVEVQSAPTAPVAESAIVAEPLFEAVEEEKPAPVIASEPVEISFADEDTEEDEYDNTPEEIDEEPDEDIDEEDDEDVDPLDDEPEEDVPVEEIPPEKQNPVVHELRSMFPILGEVEEPKSKSAATPKAEVIIPEEPKEDDVPFDDPVQVKVPSTALVPASDKKKKKGPDYSDYKFPSLDLLAKESSSMDENIQAEIQENADKLIETLASFGVTASIKGVDRGPRITRYEVVPAKGVKVSQIMNLQDDIALNLAAGSIRMEAPIPGKSAVGIEIPNKKSSIVRLRDLLETTDFISDRSKTAVCIGRDVAGQPVFGDLAKMPHLLIAGATGMGKSVCINSLLISILYKARPDEVKFIMIDPKQVEFTMYNGIPHLLVPVVSDPKQAAGALMWAVEEMERRFDMLKPLCVRNIDAYNEKIAQDPSLGKPMSKIIIVIDEFADLMLQVKDPVEALVMRIAQKARAAGIHLVIGTQRPSVNVITGVIKANVPSRISCKVMSNVDSKTVLDSGGAEKLLDKGDSLYAPSGSPKPHRVQCAFVHDSEVEAIMEYLKQFGNGENYDSSVMEDIERAAAKCSKKGGGSDRDDDECSDSSGEGYLNDRQFLEAVEVAVNTRKISTSLIQRKLSIGYGKAAKFIDIMEDMGIVGEANGQRPREVLLTPDEWREKLARASLE